MRLTVMIPFALALLACSEAPEVTGGGSSTTDPTTTDPTTTDPATTDPTTTEMTTPTATTTEPGGLCVAGEMGPCYSGPPGTVDVGLCIAGIATCLPDGSGFGPCEGEITPQAEDCEASSDENCDGLAVCPFGASLWSRQFGDAQTDAFGSLAVGSDDSIAIVGYFNGGYEFDRGVLLPDDNLLDGYVTKLSTAGDHLWSLPIEGDSGQSVGGVCIDGAGAIYIAGSFVSTIDFGGASLESKKPLGSAFIAKLGPDGEYLWGNGFTPADDRDDGADGAGFWHLACDPAGGIAVAGGVSSADAIDLGGGPLLGGGGFMQGSQGDALVARFDGDGTHLWSRRFYGSDQGVSGLARNTQGDVAICGRIVSGDTIDLGGGPKKGLPRQLFIAQFDSKGAHVWSETWGDGWNAYCGALAFDAQDALLASGSFEGKINLGGSTLENQGMGNNSQDLFLAKYAAGGIHVWSRAAGFAGVGGLFLAKGLATDAADAIYLYGQYSDAAPSGVGLPLPGSNEFAIVLAKYASDGQPLSAGAYDSIGDTVAAGIAVNSEDHVLLGGEFLNTIDFGSGSHSSVGDRDVFVAKVQIK